MVFVPVFLSGVLDVSNSAGVFKKTIDKFTNNITSIKRMLKWIGLSTIVSKYFGKYTVFMRMNQILWVSSLSTGGNCMLLFV